MRDKRKEEEVQKRSPPLFDPFDGAKLIFEGGVEKHCSGSTLSTLQAFRLGAEKLISTFLRSLRQGIPQNSFRIRCIFLH